MKIVAIFGDGANQRALANRLHSVTPLSHVARVHLSRTERRDYVRALISATVGRGFRSAWKKLDRHYAALFPQWPSVSLTDHSSANDEALVDAVTAVKPDLILVSGTDLVKASTLERLGARTMNLHTGISPYIRGGPNCTNWALALGEFDLIGNTIMWIDPGIDSGAIIVTERTPLTGRESVYGLHLAVMEHAHALYCRAVNAYANGGVRSVPQRELAKGHLFLNRHWTGSALLKAVFNHRIRYRPFTLRTDIQLIPLTPP